jgi:hypothetical protein
MSESYGDDVFEFESSDALAQFLIWMAPIAGGGVIAVAVWGAGGVSALLAMGAVCAALVAGLRSSIKVRTDRVTIRRKWFFVPYKTHTAPFIEHVCFAGDYGLEEGAMGVVVTMGGRSHHLGTSRNMRYLHDALTQAARRG